MSQRELNRNDFFMFFILVIVFSLIFVWNGRNAVDISNIDIYSISYTGLPQGENVSIYPESHIINGNSYTIIFENNRNQKLYWGSYWKAEKYVKGRWIQQGLGWGWTDELRSSGSFSTVENIERFPFDKGIYRIKKKCMLTDKYTQKDRWVDEFTVTFYLIKET